MSAAAIGTRTNCQPGEEASAMWEFRVAGVRSQKSGNRNQEFHTDGPFAILQILECLCRFSHVAEIDQMHNESTTCY
jgi:hypothetical protein